MLNLILEKLRWRTTRGRVRNRATALIHAHGELAFFRAHDAAWIAHGLSERAQAKFWEAVAREIARQVQRGAMLARIMQPAPPPSDKEPARPRLVRPAPPRSALAP
jgi:hypothetical protein